MQSPHISDGQPRDAYWDSWCSTAISASDRDRSRKTKAQFENSRMFWSKSTSRFSLWYNANMLNTRGVKVQESSNHTDHFAVQYRYSTSTDQWVLNVWTLPTLKNFKRIALWDSSSLRASAHNPTTHNSRQQHETLQRFPEKSPVGVLVPYMYR